MRANDHGNYYGNYHGNYHGDHYRGGCSNNSSMPVNGFPIPRDAWHADSRQLADPRGPPQWDSTSARADNVSAHCPRSDGGRDLEDDVSHRQEGSTQARVDRNPSSHEGANVRFPNYPHPSVYRDPARIADAAERGRDNPGLEDESRGYGRGNAGVPGAQQGPRVRRTDDEFREQQRSAKSWAELRHLNGLPTPTGSLEERQQGREPGDSLAVVPHDALRNNEFVRKASDNDVRKSDSAMAVGVYTRSPEESDDAFRPLGMHYVPRAVAKVMDAPVGWYCIAEPGNYFCIRVKACGALPVERTLDGLGRYGQSTVGLDDTIYCNIWLDNRRVLKCNTAFNTVPLHSTDLWPRRQVAEFLGYELQRDAAEDADAMSGSATLSRFQFATLEYGAEDEVCDAEAEVVRRDSKYRDYPGAIRVVMKTSRKIESMQSEQSDFGTNSGMNEDMGAARRKQLSKKEVQSTGRLGTDQSGESAAMPVHMTSWKRSDKVERRELEVMIYFRELSWLVAKGIVDGEGDFLAYCRPKKKLKQSLESGT